MGVYRCNKVDSPYAIELVILLEWEVAKVFLSEYITETTVCVTH